jgi:drug/metabolite transporter (DMT)-like permease
VLFVASSFATGSTLARIAYDHGADALSANATRIPFAACVLGILLAARRVPIRLEPRERVIALALGVLMAAYSFALFKSFETIPVPLTILIFYTYPLLTAVAGWSLGSERPSRRAVGALVLGFGGLALALDPGGGSVHWRGAGFAVLAALGFSTLLTLNGLFFRGRDSRPVTLHMLGAGSFVYFVVCFGLDDYAAPRDLPGGLALLGTASFYTGAVITLFAAVAAIGPVRTALVMNFEPIASIILGALVLGQRLAPIQLAGAACVIAALFLVRRPAKS